MNPRTGACRDCAAVGYARVAAWAAEGLPDAERVEAVGRVLAETAEMCRGVCGWPDEGGAQ